MDKPCSIQEYIQSSPAESRKMLLEIYSILKTVAPRATESIKWGIPVFEQGTILFSFAAFKDHVNFTPTGPTLSHFKNELIGYNLKQDSIQFRYDKDLPENLIREIAEYRLKDVIENNAKWKYR